MEDQFDEMIEDSAAGRTKYSCKNCGKPVHLGEDLVIVEKAVLGGRGPIPLGDIVFLCGEECVGLYFGGLPSEDLPKFPLKIP